jgi:hydrogenase-4 component B
MLRLVGVGVPAAVVIRLATVAATLVLARRVRTCRFVALGGSILASAVTVNAAIQVFVAGRSLGGVLLRHSASGIVLSYSVTPLSAWFLMVFGLIAIPVAVYSVGYFAHAIAPSRMAAVGSGFNMMLGAVELVFVAGDVITFLFAWELMTLATAALVAAEHEERASRRAGYLYLVMSHVDTGCLLAGFLTLAAASGSLSLSSLLAGNLVSGVTRDGVFVLFFVGFGVKAGVLISCLVARGPSRGTEQYLGAHVGGADHCRYLRSLQGLRVWPGHPCGELGLTFMGLGTLSAILGVLYALTQSDLKRLLAYSTIENAGIMVLGLGAGMLALAYGRTELATVAVAASLAHVLNHAVFKGLLFLGAGSVVMGTGTRQLEQFGGLLRRMPWTGLFFLDGAMAIAGLPLLNGFVSEWLTFQALLLGFSSTPGLIRLNYPLSGAMLALTSALAAACFVKAFGISFLALPRSTAAAEAHEAPRVMLAPQALLAALCVELGLFPGVVLRVLRPVLASLSGLQPAASIGWGSVRMTSPVGSLDHVVPAMFGVALLGAVVAAAGSRRGQAWRFAACRRGVAAANCRRARNIRRPRFPSR